MKVIFVKLTPAGTVYPDNTTSCFKIRILFGAIGKSLHEDGKGMEGKETEKLIPITNTFLCRCSLPHSLLNGVPEIVHVLNVLRSDYRLLPHHPLHFFPQLLLHFRVSAQ
jgi:hypothetical protein